MDESEKASIAAGSLPDDVSSLIVQLAQDRLKALQSSSAAIDQRITQIAGFQLTAAALAGSFLVNSKGTPLAGIIAMFAALSFVIGVSIAIYAVSKGHQQLPGMGPSWWHDATGIPDFQISDARAWIARHSQFCIASNTQEDERRLSLMQKSLVFGAIGGCLVLLSAGSRLLPDKVNTHQNEPSIINN